MILKIKTIRSPCTRVSWDAAPCTCVSWGLRFISLGLILGRATKALSISTYVSSQRVIKLNWNNLFL